MGQTGQPVYRRMDTNSTLKILYSEISGRTFQSAGILYNLKVIILQQNNLKGRLQPETDLSIVLKQISLLG